MDVLCINGAFSFTDSIVKVCVFVRQNWGVYSSAIPPPLVIARGVSGWGGISDVVKAKN